MLSKIVGLILLSMTIQATEIYTYNFSVKTKHGAVNFEFHTKKANKVLVENLSSVARSHIPKIVNYFGYIPEKTVNVNILDGETSSNGTAQTFPRNQIRLFTMQPLGHSYLASSLDYYKKLFVHEFIHIIHMELTGGLVDTAETIFGSVAKLLPAVVPRWFSEGIAMWAEDEFTDEGRMKNSFLLSDVVNFFKNKESCQDISCLDNPGEYPYGSLSYWAGGFFIKYLEDMKPGTVACLIKGNSKQVPFFLNNVFNSCLGENANFYFRGFLKSLKKKQYLDFLYQKGIHFDGTSANYFRDIERKVLLKIGDEDLWLRKAVVSFENILDKKVLITVDGLGRKQNYEHYEVKEDNSLEHLSSGPQYFFPTKDGDIGLKFVKNKWKIFQDGEEVEELEPFQTLVSPYLYENQIYFSGYDFSRGYIVQKYSPKSKKLRKLLTVKDSFQFIGLCDGEGGFYKGKNFYFNVGLSKVRTFKSTEDINYISANQNEVLVLTDSLEQRAGTCRAQFKSVRKKIKGKKSTAAKAKITSESYSGLSHMKPNYWFFLLSTTEDELSFWRVFTSMNDPLERHTLMINADYYTEISSWGGNVSYNYKMKYFDLGLSYLKEYEKSSANSSIQNFDESLLGSISKTKRWGLFETTLSVFYG
jgi:hypothetical protein